GGSRWLPVRRPDLYAGEVTQVIAKAHGIRLPAPDVAEQGVDGGRVLVSHESASLATIVELMLLHSTNLTAEVIGLTATAARGGDATSLEASAREMTAWMRAQTGAESAHFVDHSGLSDRSQVSPADMVRLLVKVGPGSTLHAQLK
ncbi:MAG: D-alanyl-D-alanine carboxypeptidase, partial [Maritimibacter sp.]|nr:D-alanyl-D-alanine carboxypeptidase [Maritimibacter sp.]